VHRAARLWAHAGVALTSSAQRLLRSGAHARAMTIDPNGQAPARSATAGDGMSLHPRRIEASRAILLDLLERALERHRTGAVGTSALADERRDAEPH
jgi:hypothetical protein